MVLATAVRIRFPSGEVSRIINTEMDLVLPDLSSLEAGAQWHEPDEEIPESVIGQERFHAFVFEIALPADGGEKAMLRFPDVVPNLYQLLRTVLDPRDISVEVLVVNMTERKFERGPVLFAVSDWRAPPDAVEMDLEPVTT